MSGPADPFPVAPTIVREVFAPEVVARLTAFGEKLATDGVLRGLIGPREVPRLWDRHLLNCAALAELLQPGELIADIGTGAGLPGLVLPLVRDDIRIVLIEPLQRRTDFLHEMIAHFDLGTRVTVQRAKAHLLTSAKADVVTSRAVAALDKLVAWSLPHARIGGRLLAIKGERATAELEDAGPALAAFGADRDARVVFCGAPWLDPVAQVVAATRRR
jgi:16S rRNA (guanine527-N7)-methyltransferase